MCCQARIPEVRKDDFLSSSPDHNAQPTQFAFDLNTNSFFKRDNKNFINLLGTEQLNSLKNTSLLDIFLSKNSIIEPHYHQNASELTYCISGSATVSLLNPSTKKLLTFSITPGQVVNVPQGWWHFQIATAENTHLLGIFDSPMPEVLLGSDILKLTPSDVFAYSYCLDEVQWKNATANIKPGTLIGPPLGCSVSNETDTQQQQQINYNSYYSNQSQMQAYPFQQNPYPQNP